MTNPDPTSTDAPPAHEGAHYENPASTPLRGHAGQTDREGVQRVVWALLFIVVSCVFAMAIVLGIVNQSP
jgi:hypothetical protein